MALSAGLLSMATPLRGDTLDQGPVAPPPQFDGQVSRAASSGFGGHAGRPALVYSGDGWAASDSAGPRHGAMADGSAVIPDAWLLMLGAAEAVRHAIAAQHAGSAEP